MTMSPPNTQAKTSVTPSRKRSRAITMPRLLVTAGLAVFSFPALAVDAFLAFSPTPRTSSLPFVTTGSTISTPPPPFAAATSTTSLFVTSSQNLQGKQTKNRIERPSDQEQLELLAKATEYKRIKKIETELAMKKMKKSSTTTTSTLALARACGYADDQLDQLEDAVVSGQQAREALVTRNMGLVYYCVDNILGKKGRYVNKRSVLQSLSKEDLIQEGAIGLARAVDRWDAQIGGKFSTYAVYWIRAAVLRCIAERDDLVRVPEHVSAAIRKLTKAAAALNMDMETVDTILSSAIVMTNNAAATASSSASPTNNANWKEAQAAKELAEEAGLTYKQMAQAMKVQQRRKSGIVSFESWMQKGLDYETDLTTAKPITEESTTDASSSNEKTEQMKVIFSKYLRPKEMEALSWRYGLVNDQSSPSKQSQSPKGGKDYLANAEMELFGSIEKKRAARPQQQQQQVVVPGKKGESMSFVEVGKRMQVSAEYCRRLCGAALKKLQRAAEDGSLEPGLLY